MIKLNGLATAIGSLPHKDADSALDLIFKYLPQAPFWPQLPRRDIREGMITQFTENLPLAQSRDPAFLGKAVYPRDEKILEIFYEKIISNDVDYFRITKDYAAGLYAFKERLKSVPGLAQEARFIKCHITGPFTFGASIKDEGGAVYLHDAIFFQAFIKGLAMKAIWQVRFLGEFGKDIILFIDEPYLGCFGSAYTPLNREDAVRVLTEFTSDIKQSAQASLGVHCCGNTDWSIFTDIEGIDIINFDAFNFQDRFLLYAQDLNKFLKKGGIICWGVVPTQEFSDSESAALLVKKILDGIEILAGKQVDKNLLLENMLISPSCGLGSLDIEKADKIIRVLSEASTLLKKKNT